MLAAQLSEYNGDVNALKLVQVPKPVATPGFVLVRVHYAAINPIDNYVMHGVPGFGLTFPHTLGYDLAGVVEESGEGWQQGDRVFTVNWGDVSKHDPADHLSGAFAEYALVKSDKLSRIPEGLSFELAAAVALVGSTAYEALFEALQVQAGQKVLILGASGAVGTVAVQLAKKRGAWVATTASTRNLSYVESFNATDLIVDYTKENWWEHPSLKGVDAVFDTVGEPDTLAKAREHGVLKTDGSFAVIAGAGIAKAGWNPHGHPPLRWASAFVLHNDAKIQDILAAALVSGELRLPIHKEFPFTQEGLVDLLREQQGGKSTGKNVLKIV